MQCACAILSSAASPALLYFSILSHKRHDFRKDVNGSKMCVLILSTTFVLLTARRIVRDIIKNVYWSPCKVPVILDRVLWNFNFHNRLSKNTQISNLLKIRPVGAELFHADGQTDMKKLIVAFRNFANAPKHVPLEYHPSNCSSGARDQKDSCGNLNNFWGVEISTI